MHHWLPWGPLGAALAHICEEFLWPGGFVNWYRRYRRPLVSSVTPRLLIMVNVVLIVVCTNAALAIETPFAVHIDEHGVKNVGSGPANCYVVGIGPGAGTQV